MKNGRILKIIAVVLIACGSLSLLTFLSCIFWEASVVAGSLLLITFGIVVYPSEKAKESNEVKAWNDDLMDRMFKDKLYQDRLYIRRYLKEKEDREFTEHNLRMLKERTLVHHEQENRGTDSNQIEVTIK